MLQARRLWRSRVPAARLFSSAEGSTSKNLPKNAETLVIGGGAVGCSIAYHLAKLGQKGVVLLEKTELTAGSTWHAAGLTALYHPTPNLKHLHYYSINLYSQLEAETGQAVGFHRPGSIRLATSPVRMDEFKYQMSRQQHKEAPQKLVSPEEIEKMCPILSMDGILGGLYNPYDGHIDPYSLTQALAIGARRYGAQIYQSAPVTGLQQLSGGGWKVEVADGHTVQAKQVINAAGFWAREVGQLAGLDLPLVPIEHQYLVTAPIPAVNDMKKELPVLRHLDGSFYLRQERENCLLVGPYESKESMKMCEDWALNGVPQGFGKELFPSDVDRLSPHLKVAMELVPCLSTANIQTVVCGPITYTPDLLPMVGPTRLPGMWLAVGFGYGIIHAGGVAQYLAQWILSGEPPYEMIELDPGRYGTWTDMKYTFSKARESYGMNNAVPFPHEERMAGRPTSRLSGLHDILLERNAFMSFHSGWEQPAWFSLTSEKPSYQPSFRRTNWHEAVEREWDLVMKNVGIIDLSPFAKFYLSGCDATRFLNDVTANAIPQVKDDAVFKTCITHCLTSTGKVYAELTVTAVDHNRYLVITGSGSELHDLRWLEEHARRGQYDVSLENVTDDLGCISIAGPKAGHLLTKVSPGVNTSKFPFLTGRKLNIGSVPVTALRITYTGELGWELYCDRREMTSVYSYLLQAGQEFGINDFGTLALNVLRMEKGFRMWGADMNKDTSPLEAGLGFFIKMKKEKFIGQEALLKEQREGIRKVLVPLVLETNDVDPKGDEAVWCSGKVVGNTTSGCFSYSLKKPLAFAYVPPFLSTPGLQLEVELLGQHCCGTVMSGPVLQTQPMREKKKKAAP
ncbi:dimethylglycine dehydrogenase, mitochondrial [Anabrus simplex]|uniref:dimethylglycine dehydrogenase, mitochondrial n=1 Tax=Anabrus simplex TaxID=316456 RepID=UPI0035A34748